MAQFTIPGGNNKGTPLEAADERDINFWLKRKAQRLNDEPDGRFVQEDQAWVEAAEAELLRREQGGTVAQSKPAQAPTQQRTQGPAAGPSSLAKVPKDSLSSVMSDPRAITEKLREYGECFHLVTPSTNVDAIPEGCGISVSYVAVDTSQQAKETYTIGSGEKARVGLGIDALKRIAGAAGVNWDPVRCGRLDDGSDPHYCHYRAVGTVRNFDGSLRTLTGEVEIDMREGSPQIEEIRAKSAASAKKYNKPDDGGVSQIRELRKFILRHAESKAKNRAIADMGVRRSYARGELDKPFAVARIIWTGKTEDPELKREFARMQAQSMIGGTAALYGGTQPAPTQVHQPPLPAFQGHAPPPLSARSLDTDGESQGSDPHASDDDMY